MSPTGGEALPAIWEDAETGDLVSILFARKLHVPIPPHLQSFLSMGTASLKGKTKLRRCGTPGCLLQDKHSSLQCMVVSRQELQASLSDAKESMSNIWLQDGSVS